jgi:predicted RNA-binding Zn-ribbon protein involved in translation (DUF1610 family)
MLCPGCRKLISDQVVLSEAARLYSARRTNPGRKAVMRKCPRCGQQHSARDMRKCRA